MLFGARLALIAAAAVLIAFAVIVASARTAPEAVAAPRALAEDRPNIVVIETDDQTADSMRFMENVNRLLVRQGVRFDNSYASYPLCCPSRATFLTGQYAHNHGVLGNAPPLGGYIALDHSNTLPIWLQQAGYYTALVGKYLNGYGSPETQNDSPPGWSEWRATTRQPYLGFTMNENGRLTTYPANQQNYQTDVFTRKAVDVIRRRAPSDTPFFLWLTYLRTHSGAPLDDDDAPATGVTAGPSPAARHQNRFDEEPLPMPPSFDEADVSDKPLFIRNRRRLTTEQIEAIQESYQQRLESLLAVDEGVAQVVRRSATPTSWPTP